MPLTDAACRNANPSDKPFKLADSAGLYLFVQVNGSRLWRFDYRFGDKRRTAALGKYPAVTLAQARIEQERIKVMLRAGVDPSAKAKAGATFREVAEKWFQTKKSKWKTSYSVRIWARLEDNILPTIGATAVDDVEPPTLLRLLRVVEDRDAIYSAKALRQMVSTIYEYAIAEGAAKTNPAQTLNAALKPTPKTKHRAKLKETELPEFFKRLRASGSGSTQLGLELVAHTFVRPNEIQFGQWSEIEGDVWTIPGERMKMGATHLVPLTPRSLELLAGLRKLSNGSRWILPGRDSDRKPISNNTLLYFLYDLGYHKKATVHGFRGTASTALNESGLWNYDWVERQLSHVERDEVRLAYNAAEYWEHRVKMMHWWSERLEGFANQRSTTDLSDLLS